MNANDIAQYYALNQQILELTKQAESLKKNIKCGLELGQYQVGEFKVELVQRTRIDLDKQAVEQELGERVNDFLKISAFEVLTVKKV